jgi:PAS domain S-box-containing protein
VSGPNATLMVTGGKRRGWSYVGTAIGLCLCYGALRDSSWQGSAYWHTLLEVVATLLALTVGVMALVRFYSRKNNMFLFVGSAFLGTALLDGYHAVVTSAFFAETFPSSPPALVPWSWLASRLFLSVLLWLSWLAWKREERLGPAGRISERAIYAVVGGLTVASFLFFAFVPLPSAYQEGWLLHRPQEWVAALFFLLALTGYLRKGEWQRVAFEHWLVLSMIVALVGQAVFMSTSGHLYDMMFDAAHLLKKASYALVLVGLVISMYELFRQAERGAEGLHQANLALAREAAERERAAEALRLNEQRLVALVRLNELTEAPLQQITDFALEEGVRLTRSQIGYLAFLNEDETVLTMHSWSKTAMNECAIIDKPILYPVKTTGLWGEAVRQRQPVITNDYAAPNPLKKGYPSGHVTVRRHMNVPVFDGHRIVAVAGVGNKDEPYNESDVRQLQLLMTGMWRLLQRNRAQEELRTLNESLEQRVAQRTAALQHERFLLHSLMDNVPDRIYFKDQQSRFLRNNRAHLQCFGLTDPAQAVGKTDFDFFSEAHARQAYEDEQEVIRTGQPFTKEEKETWPDGSTTWVLTTKMPMRDEHGQTVGTFGISRDITDRKRVEEAMRQAKECAEEASRAKSQFLANMSHELRTPLNSVIGFTNILLKNKEGQLTPVELHCLERVLANGKHLLALINQILDLSKIEAKRVELETSTVALDRLVPDVVSQFEGQVRDRPIKLSADLPKRMALLVTDEGKLRQILINLLGNALKFTEKGRVTVRVSVEGPDCSPTRIAVSDTGIGIRPERQGPIFEAFQQADAGTARKFGGTGLGLTISKALCDLMGCRLEVQSEFGKGSSFTIVLPLPAPLPTAPPPAKSITVPEPGRPAVHLDKPLHGRLVLVIDDDRDSRVLLAHQIEECGCRVATADTGSLGLRLAKELRPDLITLDLCMPDMDGWTVLETLKADPDLRQAPVVAVSMVGNEKRGTVLGAMEVLQKPVASEDLLRVLRSFPRPKVLVVEDNEDHRRLVAARLGSHPLELRAVANGAEALALLNQFTPDVILLDLMLPTMDGMTFLDAIRKDERYWNIPVFVITAKDLTAAERQRLAVQAQAVLKKAEDWGSDLERLLNGLLKGPSVPAPAPAPASAPSS